MTTESKDDVVEEYDLINLIVTPSNELQAVINKTENLKENDILRFIKSEHEEMIAVISEVEQFPDVTIVLMEIDPSILTDEVKKDIENYSKVDFFGQVSDH